MCPIYQIVGANCSTQQRDRYSDSRSPVPCLAGQSGERSAFSRAARGTRFAEEAAGREALGEEAPAVGSVGRVARMSGHEVGLEAGVAGVSGAGRLRSTGCQSALPRHLPDAGRPAPPPPLCQLLIHFILRKQTRLSSQLLMRSQMN